jgi:hypothetical protein
MTAGILTLRPSQPTRLAVVPTGTRAERLCLLEDLAEQVAVGTPPAEGTVPILVAALASDRLAAAQAGALWESAVAEYRRLADRDAGRADPMDLEPWRAEERLEMALADLADGTSTYADEGADAWPA